MSLPARLLMVVVTLFTSASLAQVFVIPRHAGKAQVRHFDLQWKHVDLKPSAAGCGLRPFFYEREQQVAEYVADRPPLRLLHR